MEESKLKDLNSRINKILGLCKIEEYAAELRKKGILETDFTALFQSQKCIKTISDQLKTKSISIEEAENRIQKIFHKKWLNEKNKYHEILLNQSSYEENSNDTLKPKDNIIRCKEKDSCSMGSKDNQCLSQKKKECGHKKESINELPKLKSYTSKASSPVSSKLSPIKFLRCTTLVPKEMRTPLETLNSEVIKAVEENKTFTVRGHFPAVRHALLKRGWVEKFHPNYRHRVASGVKKFNMYTIPELLSFMRNKELAELCRKLIKSKLLQDHQVDFFWDYSFEAFKDCCDKKKITTINRVRREPYSFTTKQGLCQCIKDAKWLEMENYTHTKHPRCYLLAKGGDTKGFVQDFGMTAAVSLLKWIVHIGDTKESKIVSATGKIPIRYFDFAVTEAYKLSKKKTCDEIEDISDATNKDWSTFVDYFYKIVHVGHYFKLKNKLDNPKTVEKDMINKSRYIVNLLHTHLPYTHMDGFMNIWIMKPTTGSQGRGIHICKSLKIIFDLVKANPNRRFVVQKYIEKPFLIDGRKFDIRQWFLLSDTVPLTIWMYKLCYLRFSSQPFDLKNLHESIHLTNNSVQVQYFKNDDSDSIIPKYNMWDSYQFEKFLSELGFPTAFNTRIYEGMKNNIISAMLSHRDGIDKRKNCFELYGADFLIDERFEPWLLEINSNPALHASTPVTAKLCSDVLEDVIKVMVDLRTNEKASTGNFVLIYKDDPNTIN